MPDNVNRLGKRRMEDGEVENTDEPARRQLRDEDVARNQDVGPDLGILNGANGVPVAAADVNPMPADGVGDRAMGHGVPVNAAPFDGLQGAGQVGHVFDDMQPPNVLEMGAMINHVAPPNAVYGVGNDFMLDGFQQPNAARLAGDAARWARDAAMINHVAPQNAVYGAQNAVWINGFQPPNGAHEEYAAMINGVQPLNADGGIGNAARNSAFQPPDADRGAENAARINALRSLNAAHGAENAAMINGFQPPNAAYGAENAAMINGFQPPNAAYGAENAAMINGFQPPNAAFGAQNADIINGFQPPNAAYGAENDDMINGFQPPNAAYGAENAAMINGFQPPNAAFGAQNADIINGHQQPNAALVARNADIINGAQLAVARFQAAQRNIPPQWENGHDQGQELEDNGYVDLVSDEGEDSEEDWDGDDEQDVYHQEAHNPVGYHQAVHNPVGYHQPAQNLHLYDQAAQNPYVYEQAAPNPFVNYHAVDNNMLNMQPQENIVQQDQAEKNCVSLSSDEEEGSEIASLLRHLRITHPRVSRVDVYEKDVFMLGPDMFVNDKIIELGLNMVIIERISHKLWDKIELKNTYFTANLLKGIQLKTFDNPVMTEQFRIQNERLYRNCQSVISHTRKYDIFEKEYIVFPINQDLHWMMAVIFNPSGAITYEDTNAEKKKKPCYFVHYDPLGNLTGELTQALLHLCTTYLEAMFANTKMPNQSFYNGSRGTFNPTDIIPLGVLNIVVQPNFHDCGLHIIHFFEMLFCGDLGQPITIDRLSDPNFDWKTMFPETEAMVGLMRAKLFNYVWRNTTKSGRERIELYEKAAMMSARDADSTDTGLTAETRRSRRSRCHSATCVRAKRHSSHHRRHFSIDAAPVTKSPHRDSPRYMVAWPAVRKARMLAAPCYNRRGEQFLIVYH